MTFEESVRVGELQIQLRDEIRKNRELARQLNQIVQNEMWIVTALTDLPHFRCDFCISRRAILQCQSAGESKALAHAISSQIQNLVTQLIEGKKSNDDPMV